MLSWSELRAACPNARRVGAVSLSVALAGIGIVVWWRVPWSPVPGGFPAPVAALEVFSAEEIARASQYSDSARWLGLTSYAVNLISAGVLGCYLAGSRRGRRLSAMVGGPWPLRVVVLTALMLLVGRLLTLPLALRSRALRVDYGLTTQSIPAFLWDLALGWMIGVVAISVVLVVFIGCARRWSRVWPAIAGLALVLVTMFASLVYPLVVEPLFNSFEPLPGGSLRDSIFAVADEQGVALDDVLVADASRRTTALNAYVSGWGSTRRVVVYDTLLGEGSDSAVPKSEVPESEVLSVVAHELAHARHHDVFTGSLLGALAALAGAGLAGMIVPERLRSSLVGSVPIGVAAIVLAMAAATPAQSAISRRIESRADVESLGAVSDPAAFESVQRRLAVRSLADPAPPRALHLWFGTHPLALERIAISRRVDRY
ncbi:MAG: M48 family metalloprotease [Nocardioides sp.]